MSWNGMIALQNSNDSQILKYQMSLHNDIEFLIIPKPTD